MEKNIESVRAPNRLLWSSMNLLRPRADSTNFMILVPSWTRLKTYSVMQFETSQSVLCNNYREILESFAIFAPSLHNFGIKLFFSDKLVSPGSLSASLGASGKRDSLKSVTWGLSPSYWVPLTEAHVMDELESYRVSIIVPCNACKPEILSSIAVWNVEMLKNVCYISDCRIKIDEVVVIIARSLSITSSHAIDHLKCTKHM